MDHLDPKGMTVADVFITDELERRPATEADPWREKEALQDLAARMARQPEAILPRLVELAMELTGGVSAGLSLLEPDPPPGVFRWRYLHGALARFEDETTPRDNSPCGVTLEGDGPVLAAHPERAYDRIAEAGVVIPEVLLVPLHVGGEEALGTLWIVSGAEGHFHSGHARTMTELARFVGVALKMLADERRLEQALEEQETLAQEMSHRVQNLIAVADGMVRISARNATSVEEMAQTLSSRLHALAAAHSLVIRNVRDVGRSSQLSDLETLLRTVLGPHDDAAAGQPPRFELQGPALACGPHATNALALICHELATNAAKYGALAHPDGRIQLAWSSDGEAVKLRWSESGGAPLEGPKALSGFGSTLLQRSVVGQLAGTVDYDWRPEGLAVAMILPLRRLAH